MVQDTCLGCTNCGQLFIHREPTECWICGSTNFKTVSHEPGNFECPKCGEIKENERGIKLHIKLSRDHVRAFKKKEKKQVDPLQQDDQEQVQPNTHPNTRIQCNGQYLDSDGFCQYTHVMEYLDGKGGQDDQVQVQQVDQVKNRALAREFIPVMQKYNVTSFFIDKNQRHIFSLRLI